MSPIQIFGDHVIPKGIIKLAVTMGEHPKTSMVVTKFFAVDYPSTFNGVVERLLLKALRTMTLIYCLTMKFPTTMGTRQVQGRQCDSKECYNKSLKLAEKERRLLFVTNLTTRIRCQVLII